MDVAVKECFIREKIRRKVEREIEINAQLDFKYIIKTYGYFKKYGSTYFVMERATSDLEKELAKTVPTMETRKNIILTIAEALSYTLQRGIVHHDLKVMPDNILLVDGVYKLSDFGVGSIARQISDLTQTALISGNRMHQSHDVRVLHYSKKPKIYTEFEKLQIQQYEDIYGLGILILDILLGFDFMKIYISGLQQNQEDYLYEVSVPTELDVDPGLILDLV
ncbi:protein kinase [Blastocystis sp. subtype 4]|uniref:protein kinase n=1 Tax=Blastocystis sp. subtype 4 TaxID=944170 RepID=UPI00071215EC|nr:protein kinase [Blastocystis sp. subtype 4]KNB42317.1 protein kinase [Blastocystis sp. subtype 4]|eukprot:XP_014525760.1 protein kinase [Blastocystis sp. subtype 4]